jgi:hypothetical protein
MMFSLLIFKLLNYLANISQLVALPILEFYQLLHLEQLAEGDHFSKVGMTVTKKNKIKII